MSKEHFIPAKCKEANIARGLLTVFKGKDHSNYLYDFEREFLVELLLSFLKSSA